jgi:predicted Zn-ribbon and HTH transcriptional regulator
MGGSSVVKKVMARTMQRVATSVPKKGRTFFWDVSRRNQCSCSSEEDPVSDTSSVCSRCNSGVDEVAMKFKGRLT